jgi:transcription antitermination factor NusG
VTQLSGAMPAYITARNEEPISSSSEVIVNHSTWFALQTWPKREKKVAEELQKKDVQVFLPLFSSYHQWSDRRRLVHEPLFPGYIFVRIQETVDSRVSVLRTAGVAGFVGVRGVGVPIPDDQIESVHTMLATGVPLHPHPFLEVGQRVRICGGCLDGLRGILLARNDDLSLVVSVELIQRSVAVRIAGYKVEAA